MQFWKKIIFFIFLALLCMVCVTPLRVAYSFFGFDRPKEYIVLFQNNMELRATGGFLGSYGRIRISGGKISLLKIEDIYTPDGQLDGHVDPPWPIQAAFGQGWWKLRDSNFDPDFPTSVKSIEWFFIHGKEAQADGYIALNLSFLEGLLKITGPVHVIDEPEPITVENFYKKTQAAVEIGFFPGSVAKQTFLSHLGKAVFAQTMQLPLQKKLRIPFYVWELVRDRQLFMWSHDAVVETWLHARHFDGALVNINDQTDYLAFFETNLGANKANCCIQRHVSFMLASSGKHELIIHYDNTNPSMLKQPPQYWGGAYVDYLRIGIPLSAHVTSLQVGSVSYPVPEAKNSDSKEILINLMKTQTDEQLRTLIANDDPSHVRVDIDQRPNQHLQFIGFFALVDALHGTDVRMTYMMPSSVDSLVIQKQSGITSFPLRLCVNTQTKDIIITKDTSIPIKISK